VYLGGLLLAKYYHVDQIMTSEMGGAYSVMGKKRGACKILMRKPGGKRQLVRPRRRWEDNSKMDIKE